MRLLHSRYNIQVKLNVLHNFTATVITLNGTVYYIFKLSSVSKISLNNKMPLSVVFCTAQKWTETLHRLLVAQFFFRFLKLLFKWIYISHIGLFSRKKKNIYIYIYKLSHFQCERFGWRAWFVLAVSARAWRYAQRGKNYANIEEMIADEGFGFHAKVK